MLPSFRLIAATFLCGFLAVFAGLRLVASLHNNHGAWPVMSAHAAPAPIIAIVDQDMRRGQAAMPMMYDLRFVVSAASLAPISESMTLRAIDRTAPLAPPLVIAPSLHEGVGKDQAPAPAASESEPAEPNTSAVAAINPEAAAEAASAIPPLVIAAPAEQPQPEPQAAAAVDTE
jgi:hypothetical protein